MRRSFVFFMDCGGFGRLGGKFGGMRNFWNKKIWHWKDKFDDKREVSSRTTTFDLNFTAERYLDDSFGIMKYFLVSTLKTTHLVL
jgi:hypothetical protein